MADDEPSASSPSAPSVFLSYSSEDREAARRLRDAIATHGLDVWYDEDELTGGDAWDQKIRDRIRRCDYFVPLISHSTEKRREGYFRREWRQAAERTLDMADDVLFLLPIAIGPVPDAGARVPERFYQVQWIRCHGGQPNPELDALCERMLNHAEALPPPVPVTFPTSSSSSTPPLPTHAPRPPRRQRRRRELPPYPAQPKRATGESEWLHLVHLFVWGIRCAYRAFRGFPWLLRFAATVWLFMFFIRGCSKEPAVRIERDPDTAETTAKGSDKPDQADQLVPALGQITRELKGNEGLSSIGRFVSAFTDAAQSGRTLAIVPFAAEDNNAATTQFADAVFGELWTQLRKAHEGAIAVSPQSLGAAPSRDDLQARATRLESKFLLAGWVELPSAVEATADESPAPAPAPATLHVVLHGNGRTQWAWSQDVVIDGADPIATAQTILTALEQNAFAPPADGTDGGA